MDKFDFGDLNDYRIEIEDAYKDVTEAFDRWRQRMEWALKDVKKASGDSDEQLHMQFKLLQVALAAEDEYRRGVMDSILTIGGRLVLDLEKAGVLEGMPPEMKEGLERHLKKHEETSIEGVGSWKDLLGNVKEPERPKKEEEKPKGIRDADGNYK